MPFVRCCARTRALSLSIAAATSFAPAMAQADPSGHAAHVDPVAEQRLTIVAGPAVGLTYATPSLVGRFGLAYAF